MLLQLKEIKAWYPSCTDMARRPASRPHIEAARVRGETTMLYYALVFLLIAIVAAVFGFGGVAVVSAGIAKILFFIFIVLFLVSLITHMSRRV
jgi:uncharacterized membrane protein YtjA (UPF0391 family)